MHNPILWITAANVIYLASYSVRDILWLRVLTVAAAALLIPFYAMQAVPLKTAIEWNVVFIAINVYWIVRLLIERRPVHFSSDEAQLRRLCFATLPARDTRDLYSMGAWHDLAPETSIVMFDREGARFSVILRGQADVIYHGTKISEFGEGQFVGTVDLQADTFGDFEVMTRTATRVMSWPRKQLQAFLAKHLDVELAMERSVGTEVRHLLDATVSRLVPQ